MKVNKDFHSIFSALLPNASAKLEAPQGMSETEGLEIKVAFGSVWKNSLSELSGGQRSLLSLSLVLALLLFKPAPMYILDEIDSALDLSHTQNIGHMIWTHFPHSQFIVVSLKEGVHVSSESAVDETRSNQTRHGGVIRITFKFKFAFMFAFGFTVAFTFPSRSRNSVRAVWVTWVFG